jgi:hypothetical protein
MGSAVEIPADRADGFALACDECGRVERFKARFMGCRVRELGRARREGWGWRRDGRLVDHAMPDGSIGRRVARLCPACDAIERQAAEGGLWGHLLAGLRAFRAELPGQASGFPSQVQNRTDIAQAVDAASIPRGGASAAVVHLHPSGQLDLFGHPT